MISRTNNPTTAVTTTPANTTIKDIRKARTRQVATTSHVNSRRTTAVRRQKQSNPRNIDIQQECMTNQGNPNPGQRKMANVDLNTEEWTPDTIESSASRPHGPQTPM